MTIEALQGTVERPRDAGGAATARDTNIFLCPRCTRPLAAGVAKCSGCGTRLVAGVPLIKVGGFVVFGLVAGLFVGGGSVAALTTLGRPAAVPVAMPLPGTLPSVAPASIVPAPIAAPITPLAPPAALTALRQSTVVNQRLLADADLLRAAMAGSSPSAAEIAPLLRNLASTAAFGDRAASSVATWDAGAAVATSLGAFYESIDRVAGDGLAASVTNEGAYRDAGRRMLAVLADLPDVDAASRALAATVDVELPPLAPNG